MLDPEHIIATGGLLLIAAIIFSESGLLFGFFLPGDTLLFAAGFFAAKGTLSLEWLIPVLIFGAIAGYQVGYIIGQKLGPRLFRKKDGLIFRQEYVERAEMFYEKHGGKATMLARFVPVVRTIAPVLAGVAKMPPRTFWTYNIAGAVIWITSVTLLGYKLGEHVHNIDKYILPAVIAATVLSFSPTVYHMLRDERIRSATGHKIKSTIKRITPAKRK